MLDPVSFFILSFSSLFTLVDPLGFAPIFLSLVEGMDKHQKIRVARKGVLTASIVLLVFWSLGRLIFSFFGITVDAFRIAGGILFFKLGMNMLEAKISRTRSTPKEEAEAEEKEDIAYTPIGIPLIAGPGAITSVMILSSEATSIANKGILLIQKIPQVICNFVRIDRKCWKVTTVPIQNLLIFFSIYHQTFYVKIGFEFIV